MQIWLRWHLAPACLPAIGGFRDFAIAATLASYGASLSDLYRRKADFIDKVFKGANPADLPIERPIKFEFVINLKTAKALGLTIGLNTDCPGRRGDRM